MIAQCCAGHDIDRLQFDFRGWTSAHMIKSYDGGKPYSSCPLPSYYFQVKNLYEKDLYVFF